MSRLLSLLLFIFCLALPNLSEGQTISGPDVRLINNDIYVSFSLKLDSKHIQEIKDGIEKELKIYVDLFRVWNSWPDEFVLGKFYSRSLRSDPIKKEHVAVSNDGNVIGAGTSSFLSPTFRMLSPLFYHCSAIIPGKHITPFHNRPPELGDWRI